MTMNIQDLTTDALIMLHDGIAKRLKEDDQNPSPEKKYEVRLFRDWKISKDEIEAELTKRDVQFTPIEIFQ